MPNFTTYFYTFGGVTFSAEASGRWDAWFRETEEVEVTPVLDSSASYTDIGGLSREPFTKTAGFASEADRDQLIGKWRTTGTLSNIGQRRSRRARLVSAHEIDGDGLYFAEVTFVAVDQ